MVRIAWILLSAIVLAGCSHAPPDYVSHYTPEPDAPKAVSVAVVGDSYTGGSPMGGEGDKGWAKLAAGILRKQGVNIALTVSADGGTGYVKRGPEGLVFADEIPKAVDPNDRLVVLFGSRNDAEASPADLAPGIKQTLDAARAKAPTAKILVIGPPWLDTAPPAAILQARDILAADAPTIGAIFVDPIGWFVGHPEFIGPDGIHPTDAGHAYMAEKIAPLIAQQLTA